ncbi:alpha/beta fold hydrolase [Tropicibacter oceani]|uniref:Alpha/beta hydrolase n=1 Tax=Tropicibacter oceani TaxID=3058420 RepID=A0ABY8QI92_9RHOB|nr:alpha/beta hydrolase [Tropicibacter oceani]WGW04357.1 alpha/beta hydrolase [Tropicibacter oceani]
MQAHIPGFTARVATPNGVAIAYESGGNGPPLLLLHGFPQTRAMWAQIAPVLAQDFTVIAADLRGYGDSGKPKGLRHYSFREMAADITALMAQLGFDRFHLVGHDRGGRTAHRLALDAPEAVQSLTVMDIVPTHLLLNDLTMGVAKAYYHWFYMAQPEPFPERMIGADPDHFYESCLLGWGAAQLSDFDPSQLQAYRSAWRDPETIRAMCDDYRAAIEVDFALDAADLGRQVQCPALVMYGADGAMAQAYDVPATWSDRLARMQKAAVPGGHFFPDQHPAQTAQHLRDFLLPLA